MLADPSCRIEGDGYTILKSKRHQLGKRPTVQGLNSFRRHTFQSIYAGDGVFTRTYQTILMWAVVLLLIRNPPKLPIVQKLCAEILDSHCGAFGKGINRLAELASSARTWGPECPLGLSIPLFSLAPNVRNPQIVSISFHHTLSSASHIIVII